MSRKPKIVVVGGGSGGHALAALLALGSARVHLVARSANREAWQTFVEGKTIAVSGAWEGLSKLEYVGSDARRALEGADFVFLSLPAFAYESYFQELVEGVSPGATVVFLPGNYASLRLSQGHRGCVDGEVGVLESNTLPFAARVREPGRVFVAMVKKRMFIGGASSAVGHREALERLQHLVGELPVSFPDLVWLDHVVNVNLANVNGILHVPLMLLNASQISRADGSFSLFGQGLSSAVDQLSEALDGERLKLASALGWDLPTGVETLIASGFESGSSMSEVIKATRLFPGIVEETHLSSRQLSEELPFSFKPMSDLGHIVNVDVGAIRGSLTLGAIISGGCEFPLELKVDMLADCPVFRS